MFSPNWRWHGNLLIFNLPTWKGRALYKKVLIAIDDSQTARCAPDRSCLYRQDPRRRPVHCPRCRRNPDGHAPPYPHHHIEPGSRAGAIVDAGKKLLEEAIAQVADRPPKPACSRRATDAFRKSSSAAQEWQTDLIVVGTHGRRGWNAYIGSVADQLVRLSRLSTLLVRKH